VGVGRRGNDAPPPGRARQTSGLLRPVGILGTGMHLPPTVLSNADLERRMATSDDWITAKTGIRERRVLDAEHATSDLCIAAARQALDNAGVRPGDLDAVLLATISPDHVIPSTALIVAEALGARSALPLDLGHAACTGALTALLVGSHLLQNRQFRNVLVIGSEAFSRIVNPQDRSTAIFFGDGAGALVLRRLRWSRLGVLAWDMGASLSHAVTMPHGGARHPLTEQSLAAGRHLVHMDGPAVWQRATTCLPQTIRACADKAAITPDQIDFFVMHQASCTLVRAVTQELGIPEDRTHINADLYGNTGAATLPIALHEALSQGRIHDQDLVSLSAIGAGFTWGSVLLRHSTQPSDFE